MTPQNHPPQPPVVGALGYDTSCIRRSSFPIQALHLGAEAAEKSFRKGCPNGPTAISTKPHNLMTCNMTCRTNLGHQLTQEAPLVRVSTGAALRFVAPCASESQTALGGPKYTPASFGVGFLASQSRHEIHASSGNSSDMVTRTSKVGLGLVPEGSSHTEPVWRYDWRCRVIKN